MRLDIGTGKFTWNTGCPLDDKKLLGRKVQKVEK